jgi:hypothetical protein
MTIGFTSFLSDQRAIVNLHPRRQWCRLERRALLGVEKLSQTEPSNARRSD